MTKQEAMGLFNGDYDIRQEKKSCPCCNCDRHWMACRFCEWYETKEQDNHFNYHTN